MTTSRRSRLAVGKQSALIVAVAGPGYGKTTALRRLLPPARHLWADRACVQAIAAGRLPDPPTMPDETPRWLVLDDLPRLDADSAQRLLDWASALPASTGVAIATRYPLPVRVSRWCGTRGIELFQPDDLALTVTEAAAVLRDDHDLRDPDLATAVHAVTGGWAALVSRAASTLAAQPRSGADRTMLLAALAQPATAIARYVLDEVLAAVSASARRLLRDLSSFDPVSLDLCDALGRRSARRSFDELVTSGAIRPVGGAYRVVPIVGALAATGQRPPRAAQLARLAADWYAQQGLPLAAARARVAGGEPGLAARLLTEHGEEILSAGAAVAVADVVGALPPALLTPQLRLLWADALRSCGDVSHASAIFDELAQELAQPDGLPAGLAWRMGLLQYLRGEPRSALTTFARAVKSAEDPLDDVMVLGWTAAAYWMLGEASAADEHAVAALQAAREFDRGRVRDRALASAHTAMALARKLAGDADTAETHYAEALRHAQHAGDLVQASRVLGNQAHELLTRARYPQALTTARRAVVMAEQTGPPGSVVVALCNEAEALNRLGRFDEAVECCSRVIAICRRTGLRRAASAFVVLGDVYRRRGWREQARMAYDQALAIARDSREVQSLAPALIGLGRVQLDDDLDAAETTIAEVAACATSPSSAAALQIAQGWLCRARGDVAAAAAAASQAVQRARQQPAALAEALELRAAADPELPVVRAALAEAHQIWRECGASVDADRVVATIGSLPDASSEERLAGSLARQRLADAGVQHAVATVELSLPGGGRSVHIRVLGRLEVRVGDQPVPAAAWQSRKARDLLRILVARRGRAVPREELAELLWPGETGTGHRLSVLLSILRGTLDPDRTYESDRFVIADKSGIALDSTWVRVDVAEFFDAVSYGGRLYEQGDDASARAILAAAVTSYQGDPFDDDPYPDWTASLREQARAAFMRGLRLLARLARRVGDTDEALRHLLLLVELDPFDEDAHRSMVAILVAAGRHGEARRADQRYRHAMSTLGLPPPADLLLPTLSVIEGSQDPLTLDHGAGAGG